MGPLATIPALLARTLSPLKLARGEDGFGAVVAASNSAGKTHGVWIEEFFLSLVRTPRKIQVVVQYLCRITNLGQYPLRLRHPPAERLPPGPVAPSLSPPE